ncbi:MAG: serine/threonine protein kinase, partial [Clostridiaceae bacterium]|nr:serine/threonine protein kinase [Clostridiaceae bacterium]
VSLYNAGKYKEAKAAFETIKEYKDSIIYLQNASLKSSEVGSYIYFGEYEQDNNTSNNKESIEWQVLAKENNRFLVVSRYALDCKEYNETYKTVTWETCTLRTWLNGSFYDNAFSSSEKAMILSSTIANENNPEYGTAGGNKTTDRVFLLSISEAQKYFSSDYERRTEATAYAVKNGVWVYDSDSDCCLWWLRSPGYSSNRAASVDRDGSVDYTGNYVLDVYRAVRPAMWIDISNLEP